MSRCGAEEARAALFNGPERAEWWVQFAQLCDELDAALGDLPRQAGKHAEPLSFSAEAQTARHFADVSWPVPRSTGWWSLDGALHFARELARILEG